MNFVETNLQASLDNSQILKTLELLSEVNFMLLVISVLMLSQVNFWHRVQIDLLEFGMRLAAVNV